MTLTFDNSYRRLPANFYSELNPVAVRQPQLVHANPLVADLLGMTAKELNHADFAHYFSGNKLLPGSEPLAMVYAGHQFGYYVPQLGDGRALLLGEVLNPQGQRWDLQLKGSGQTPYSRMGDGRAVLRSTIREYLCSETMHALGMPTTRALCLVTTDETVYREVPEPGAILTRVAASHIRFGHFEYFYYSQQYEALTQLADYVLARHYPTKNKDKNGYHYLFEQAVLKTARLIALWQAYGFCHGVMNTDNMSILGHTIDYGPFGFLDNYDPGHICNHSDDFGRYAYNQQPAIAHWNLTAFAQALTPLIAVEQLNETLQRFEPEFKYHYLNLYRKKLGLAKIVSSDSALIKDLLSLMAENKVDYTHFFRQLGSFIPNQSNPQLTQSFENKKGIESWLHRYAERLGLESGSDEERQMRMNQTNPKYILRNYLAQQAIEEAYEKQHYREINRLFHLLLNPYDEQPGNASYAALPPEGAPAISISCSS